MRRHYLGAGREHRLVLPSLRPQEHQDRQGQEVQLKARQTKQALIICFIFTRVQKLQCRRRLERKDFRERFLPLFKMSGLQFSCLLPPENKILKRL